MWFLIIDFPQTICDYDYYIICLLCGNYTSLHCIKATVPSIRYFNWQKIGLLFRPINWRHTLVLGTCKIASVLAFSVLV